MTTLQALQIINQSILDFKTFMEYAMIFNIGVLFAIIVAITWKG